MSQYTSYYQYQKYESRDGGQTFVPVYPNVYSIYSTGEEGGDKTVYKENDPKCGCTVPVEGMTRWIEITNEYVCDDCE